MVTAHDLGEQTLKLQKSHRQLLTSQRQLKTSQRRVTDNYRRVTDQLKMTTDKSQTITDEPQTVTGNTVYKGIFWVVAYCWKTLHIMMFGKNYVFWKKNVVLFGPTYRLPFLQLHLTLDRFIYCFVFVNTLSVNASFLFVSRLILLIP